MYRNKRGRCKKKKSLQEKKTVKQFIVAVKRMW